MTGPNGRSRFARFLFFSAVGALGVAGARHITGRRKVVAGVAPELRTPLLWLPTDLTNDSTLAFARRWLVRPTVPVPDVVLTTVRVPGSAGGPDVPVITYQRADRSKPSGALVWIHGGGTVLGRAEMAHDTCSRIARDLDVLVVNVDYRLAPEDPFPAGLDDCTAALAWVHEQADALGVDPARVAVGGDSAGGLLAAAVTQRARDESRPPICFQLLVYPMLDDRTVARPAEDGGDALLWTPASNRYAWGAYLGHPAGGPEDRPHAVPARTADLAGLPPAWIGVGDIDLFHDEDVDYARRLAEAGVACELHVEPGMWHGADSLLPDRPSMRAFRTAWTEALRAALAPAPA